MEHIKVGKNEKILCDIEKAVYISLICDSSVTTQIFAILQEKRLEVLKCRNFPQVQRRHNCSPAASFANCVMTLYLLKVHLQTLLFYINKLKKCEILIYDTLVATERHSKHKALKVQVPSALSCRSCCLRAADPHNSVCQTIILTMGCFECLRKTLKAR
jgi:hypothetical protein